MGLGKVIIEEQRNLQYLKKIVNKIWKVIKGAETYIQDLFPQLKTDKYPNLPRKTRETEILKEHPAIFILGIGYPLKDGYPHELRAPDYDDWITETVSEDGRPMHGLNGDILVWNPVTQRRHELTSMGIRVDPETLKKQLEMSGLLHFLNYRYHQAIINNEIPLSIGGGHRTVKSIHATTKKNSSWRSKHNSMAKNTLRNMQEKKHTRT